MGVPINDLALLISSCVVFICTSTLLFKNWHITT